MITGIVLVALLGAAQDAPESSQGEAFESDSAVQQPTEPGAAGEEAQPSQTDLPPPRRPKRKRLRRPRSLRTLEELERCDASDDPRCALSEPKGAGLGVERPPQLGPRSHAGAASLGFIIGFGTGFYYAGDAKQGLAFTLVDGVLWIGLTATVAAFTQIVVRNDFRTELSLRRGERDFGKREGRLYGAIWALSAAVLASHTYQGFGSLRAARRMNRILDGFSFVPLGDGAAMEYQLGF